ncbi:MAG: hypothetical protein WC992_03775 [Acholeplasmataceae bacterium]
MATMENRTAQVVLTITTEAAVRAGKIRSGSIPVDLTEEYLAGLTPEQREVVAGMAHTAVFGAVEPTLDELTRLVNTQLAEKAEKRQKAEEEAAEWRRQAARVIAERRITEDGKVDWPRRPDGWYASDELIAAMRAEDPAVAELEMEAEAVAEAVQREKRKSQEEEAAQAAAARYREACEALVRQIGTQDQVERMEAGMLPNSERLDLVYSHIFRAFAGKERYRRLTAEDACHDDDCDDPTDVEVEAGDCSAATAAQWQEIKEFRSLLSEQETRDGADVDLRWHEVECWRCRGKSRRWSLRVTIYWHGKAMTREYAATPGNLADAEWGD